MKTNNEKTIRSAMDRRLSFLDDLPSCRAAVQSRIAQEEAPVMKKKLSFGFVFAIVLMLATAAALAVGLLLSPRAEAVQAADRALAEKYHVTAEMQTFFARAQEETDDGAVRVTYTGAGSLERVLGTYTAIVKDGKAEISWSHDGTDTSGGYEAQAWGAEQLKAMVADSRDPGRKQAYMDRADQLAAAVPASGEDPEITDEQIEAYYRQREADKDSAMNARRLSEDEMIATGRAFIVSNWHLNAEQTDRLELYTNSLPQYPELIGISPDEAEGSSNEWYETVNGKPCFKVEYLLYQPLTAAQEASGEERDYQEGDGYYIVYVNVETGEIEEFEYNSALGGIG